MIYTSELANAFKFLLKNHFHSWQPTERMSSLRLDHLDKVESRSIFCLLLGQSSADIKGEPVSWLRRQVHWVCKHLNPGENLWNGAGLVKAKSWTIWNCPRKRNDADFLECRRDYFLGFPTKEKKTVTWEYYGVLIRQVRSKVRKTRGQSHWFLQDNAPVHTCRAALKKINSGGFELVEYPPYSHDLAPSDYCFFNKLKRHLRGKHFESADALRDGEKLCFHLIPHFFPWCLHGPPSSLEKMFVRKR